MEVHAHSHTERKKWTHYFWEFLCCSCRCSAGFWQSTLEHKIEADREKQFMITISGGTEV
jgi:hypothetical protein